MMGDELGDHFRVGIAAEDHPLLLEVALQGGVIFDDAVMDDRDQAVAADMGMGVRVCGGSVRRPAGVTDAVAARGRPLFQIAQQVGEPAGPPPHVQTVAGQGGHARAVVTAVLQSPKSFHEDRLSLAMTDVANDSTHRLLLRVSGAALRLTSAAWALAHALTIRQRSGARLAVAFRVSTSSR